MACKLGVAMKCHVNAFHVTGMGLILFLILYQNKNLYLDVILSPDSLAKGAFLAKIP